MRLIEMCSSQTL